MIGDAVAHVYCDQCNDYDEEVELTPLAGHTKYDMRNVVRSLEQSGWRVVGGIDGQHICPNCNEEDE